MKLLSTKLFPLRPTLQFNIAINTLIDKKYSNIKIKNGQLGLNWWFDRRRLTMWHEKTSFDRGEGVLVHVMTAQVKVRLWLHLCLTSTFNGMNAPLHASVTALHEKQPPESSERKAGWASEPIWMDSEHISPARVQNPNIAILTTLFQPTYA